MKKNILLLISQLKNGGAEHSIINLANELSKTHNVVLAAINISDPDYKCNVPIIEIKKLKSRNIISKLKGIKELKTIKKKYKIDVSISYTTTLNFYNAISKTKDKTITSVRNHLSTKNESFVLSILTKITAKLCDYVVCCSKSVKEDQIKKYYVNKNKAKVINNFCDEERIKEVINDKKTINNSKMIDGDYFVTLARLVPHKGQIHIIKALSEVVKTYPNVKLLIFGRGPLEDKLKELVKKYKLESNVIFMGFYSEPYYYISKAKGCILASDYEGFPNVIIEAMACGSPVIATDAPGGSKEILTKNDFNDNNSITNLLETDYGILIPSFIEEHSESNITKNEIELKKAMELILGDKDKYEYYHLKSLERIKEFSKKKTIKKWLELIE